MMENQLVEDYLQIVQEDYLEEGGIYSGFGQTMIKLTSGEATVAGIMAAAAIIYMAVKAINYLSTSKECRNYKSESVPWRICEKKVRIENDKRKIKLISAKVNLCNNSKQPEKCKAKLKEEITKLQVKIKRREVEIKQLQSQVTK